MSVHTKCTLSTRATCCVCPCILQRRLQLVLLCFRGWEPGPPLLVPRTVGLAGLTLEGSWASGSSPREEPSALPGGALSPQLVSDRAAAAQTSWRHRGQSLRARPLSVAGASCALGDAQRMPASPPPSCDSPECFQMWSEHGCPMEKRCSVYSLCPTVC